MGVPKAVRAKLDEERITHRLRGSWRRLPETLRARQHRVRANIGLATQSGLAAAISWLIGHDLLGHAEPVFAPLAAVGTLAASIGQRLRNTVELVVGVALGVAVADAVVAAIGAGWWQLGLVTVIAIVASIFVGGGPALVTQAASAAVLIATLSPPTTTGIYASRFFEALLGGAVSLAVIMVVPVRPLALVRRAVDPVLDVLTASFSDAGAALAERDRSRANAALDRLRGAEDELAVMRESLQAGQESATLAPAHWNARGTLRQYVNASEFLMRAVRNGRMLSRRCVTAIDANEPLPPCLPATLTSLSESVVLLKQELRNRGEARATRDRLLEAASRAGEAYAAGVGFSGNVIIAQVRATAIDLLQATGVGPEDANVLVRAAVARRAPNQPPD
ncbi:FUSC family protein [Micromonospora sp. NPDC049679]|uniref:FUSC family protein n=1 Tax=Micromonospora sp. NPDC049679 TaxID=3155920 RepID=UPI0033CC4A4A